MRTATANIQNVDTDGNRIQDPIRFEGTLSGRFYAEKWFRSSDRASYLPTCVSTTLMPDRVVFTCPASAEVGDRAFVHFKEVGLLRGRVSRVIGARISMDVEMTDNERNRLSSSLLWLERKSKFSLSDKRLFPRYQPRNGSSSLRLESGVPVPCQIINVSPTGAAVMSSLRPDLRRRIELGQVPGDVVRHTDFGFALQFVQIQDPVYLEDLLGPAADTDFSQLHLQEMQIIPEDRKA